MTNENRALAVLTNQRPVLPVDHDGDGQGEDEDAGEGAEAANQLPQQGLGVELVAHRGDGHQAPPRDMEKGWQMKIMVRISPESLYKCPSIARMVDNAGPLP